MERSGSDWRRFLVTPLHALAQAHGIALEYHDIWGNLHRVDDDALRALLAAMHVRAGDDAEVAQSLGEHEALRWAHRLAPMSVLRTHRRPWSLHVRVPRPDDDAALAWRVTGETGEVRHLAIDRARIAPGDAIERDGVVHVALDVDLAFDLAAGYYRIALLADDEVIAQGDVAVAPPACHRPAALASGGRAWGAAVQLYGVRSPRNWGIGDFGDLGALAGAWGAAGADVVGVNPLHALFPHDPRRTSPYSPSSRLFVNPLYLDVVAVPEVRWSAKARAVLDSEDFQRDLAALREADLVQHAGVAAAKHRVLGLAYDDARRARNARARARWAQFESFRSSGGEALRRHARFEALQEHLHRADANVWGWPAWPPEYRDPEGAAVQRFADEHADRVDYYAWLQWQAAQQRSAAAERARKAGMTVGLYTDLAVSVDRGGAETWSQQDLYATEASVGAPPDAFNVHGQDWGLPPLVPSRLVATGYAPFLATLRATMRDAGALRIDHVMGLCRLFWIPGGQSPARGAYVRYPLDDLLGLLALESHRHRCAVIGEDLGTVPDEVRHALASNDILSYRVLMFERDDRGDFKPPGAYPVAALATATTHDLPTLAGWWEGHDIGLRAGHGMLGNAPDLDREYRHRREERERLVAALVREGLLDGDQADGAAQAPLAPHVALLLQRYLARSPSALMVVQPEDVLGVREPANLPGTTDQHPNWRRRLPASIEALVRDERFVALAQALRAERPRASVPREPNASRRTAPPPLRRPAPAVALPLDAIPRSTYRLQLHSGFTFRDVTALVPYFAELGVSHLYLSPYLRARPGSTHGYDVVDHAALNPEIGTRADFDAMVAALAAHGLRHVCDVVPNHMAVLGADNAWWMDVLQHGQASAYAPYFDIDWEPPDASLRGKVLVPVLGQPFGMALEQGELVLKFEADAGTFAFHYHEHRLPIDPRTYPDVLAPIPDGKPERDFAALRQLAEAWSALPARDAIAASDVRRERATELCGRLARLVADCPGVRQAIDDAVTRLNGMPGAPRSFDALEALLDAQAWRVAHWRVAGDEINYRRFFDINELAGLRTDRDDVFRATHDFLLGLAAEGSVAALRIDHPDGLRDPARYFDRLQSRYGELAAARGKQAGGLYVVVEKIAATHEPLPVAWRVQGDTGYGFLNAVNGVLVDPTARVRVDRAWRGFVGDEADHFERIAYASKRAILAGPLAAALTTITGRAHIIARADRSTRDFTFSILRRALAETAAWFPVYRTYVSAAGASRQDERYVDWAVARARRTGGVVDPTVFDFVRALLLARSPSGASPQVQAQRLDFALAFQQFTAPVAAKGVEDTAFYRHARLVAQNEVGGEPHVIGLTRRAFHREMRERARCWPHALSASSTHDNKRSEDVRARIGVIAERIGPWRQAVRRWSQWNRSRKRDVDGARAPSRSDEYLLYQTLVGTFPAHERDAGALDAYRKRIAAYAVKAAREAKRHTSWIVVDEAYEEALTAFVDALLVPRSDTRFLDDLRREAADFAWYGGLVTLSATLLKFAAPGVPDIYQGNETLDLSLVDPDNRRPVDFAARRLGVERLRGLDGASPQDRALRLRDLLAAGEHGDAKLWLVLRGLAFRNAHPALVAFGDYVPLEARGARARHVLAFARRHDGATMVAVAGRLYASMGLPRGHAPVADAWGDDQLDVAFLPDGTVLEDAISGALLSVADGRLSVAAVLAAFPCALLAVRG